MSWLSWIPDDGYLPLLTPLLTWIHFQWVNEVDQNVPQPYMDEIFHIPQANAYWRGNWSHWDDKITTPPGLYFYSIFLNALFDFDYAGTVGADLSAYQLRWSNFLLVYLLILVYTVWKWYAFEDETQKSGTVVHLSAFPLLFFFGGLYYTDVFAALTVMCTYLCWEAGKGTTGATKLGFQFLHLLAGLVSLTSRQTNIFWSAIFLGGLQAVYTIKQHSKAYDPPVGEAFLEDAATTILSLCTSIQKVALQLVLDLWPSLALVAAFGAFVIWNGGVVLGDKSNHIAGLHLPQVLYIWPFLIAFSWPVLLPQLTNMRTLVERRPRIWLVTLTLALMTAIVHYNTIIHPFILADNRHYTFYVFKLMRTYWWSWYAAVPVYALCMWLAVQALTNVAPTRVKTRNDAKAGVEKQEKVISDTNNVSFVLVWFASTALSLITAPLVEPRYFIIPWLIWRLHVPTYAISTPNAQTSNKKEVSDTSLAKTIGLLFADRNAIIELVWYLAINYVTCHLFIDKPFVWSSEPGQLQRFMW